MAGAAEEPPLPPQRKAKKEPLTPALSGSRFVCGGASMRLSDNIGSVLKNKGGAVFSVTPDQSVYQAVEAMADKGLALCS